MNLRDPWAVVVARLKETTGPVSGVALLTAILLLREKMKVQPVGDLFLCSVYINPKVWDIWISEYDPRTTELRARGRLGLCG